MEVTLIEELIDMLVVEEVPKEVVEPIDVSLKATSEPDCGVTALCGSPKAALC